MLNCRLLTKNQLAIPREKEALKTNFLLIWNHDFTLKMENLNETYLDIMSRTSNWQN